MGRASAALGWMHALVLLAAVAPEPAIALRIPAFPDARFANYAAVLIPDTPLETLELHLSGTLAPIQPSTVRVTMNGVPMTPFVSTNLMPGGARVIVRLGLTLSPEYRISRDGESILGLDAKDTDGTAYRGQFYLTIDPSKTQPELARSTRVRAQQGAVVAPPVVRAPGVEILSAVPAVSTQVAYELEADVTDEQGLRRIVVEVNGKDVEEIVLQNERPVRYRGGRLAKGATPGEATGDGTRVRLKLPLRLSRGRLNVVAIRAENVRGLSTRSDQTIEVLK